MQDDFRWVLKEQTAADHDAVDDLLSALDVSSADGLEGFLGVHRACFAAMLPIAVPGDSSMQAMTGMIACIERDLATLGAPCDVSSAVTVGPVDVLACDYVLEGSRLGSKVLRRRWEASEDPRVRAADAYFSITPVSGRWREVCDALSAVAPDSPRAAHIIRDTKSLFALFENVAKDWLPGQGQYRKVSI